MAQGMRKNPFYVLLVVTGLAFAITACGFGVMTFTDVHGPELLNAEQQASAGRLTGHPLFEFLDKHGTKTMLIELAVLALATIGCIATDSWLETRQELSASAGSLSKVDESALATSSSAEETTSPAES